MGESHKHDGEQENQTQRSTDDLVYSVLTKCKNNQHWSMVTEVRKVVIFEGADRGFWGVTNVVSQAGGWLGQEYSVC